MSARRGRSDMAHDPRRRALLGALPFGLLAACAPKASAPVASVAPASFSARFLVVGAGAIVLDYADETNFAFTPELGWGSTCIVDGRIHLVMLPSLATAGSTRVLLAGTLGPRVEPSGGPAPRLQPSATDAQARAAWGLDRPVRDVQVPMPGVAGASMRLSVGEAASLARAQYAIDTRLRAGMDMSLCGDSVNRLLSTWPAVVTAHGLAVLASDTGARLASAPGPLLRRPALPQGVTIEDYRVSLARPG